MRVADALTCSARFRLVSSFADESFRDLGRVNSLTHAEDRVVNALPSQAESIERKSCALTWLMP